MVSLYACNGRKEKELRHEKGCNVIATQKYTVCSTKSPIFPWQTMVGLKSVYMAKLSFGSYPHMPGGGGENISAPKIHIL